MLIQDRIVQLMHQAIAEAQRQDLLPPTPLPEIVIEHPQNTENGDYATSLPLKLARSARMNPMIIAESLLLLIPTEEWASQIWVAPPGFINFQLDPQWVSRQVDEIIERGSTYSKVNLGNGQKVQVEYVSVNPTGPVHVGHARGAVLGSVLARVLSEAGYKVTREYYINNSGSQMQVFYKSLYVRYIQYLGKHAEMPLNGYMGDYMIRLAENIWTEMGDRFLSLPQEAGIKEIGEIGLSRMIQQIEEDLKALGVEFDVWFSEDTLYREGQYQKVMETLDAHGHVTQREGATWFVSSALGEDKDNVLVRSTGAPTYFASDVAYHYNKFLERKFDRVINIWGADHQGHVSRMKAVLGALGIPSDRLTILISQLVTLKRGDAVVRASKRTGDLITLRELVSEVTSDACRFFFLTRSPESQMEFDLELAQRQTSDNPVYYVQYAHARIASILRIAREHGVEFQNGDLSLLTHPAEQILIKKLIILPELVDFIARSLEPHHLSHYSMELANAFHWFYRECRVISEKASDQGVMAARLKLVSAAKIVLASSLELMGMSAPDKM
jgi:arginyl-tRNA synthetase